jgi:hypothetical protein
MHIVMHHTLPLGDACPIINRDCDCDALAGPSSLSPRLPRAGEGVHGVLSIAEKCFQRDLHCISNQRHALGFLVDALVLCK